MKSNIQIIDYIDDINHNMTSTIKNKSHGKRFVKISKESATRCMFGMSVVSLSETCSWLNMTKQLTAFLFKNRVPPNRIQRLLYTFVQT